MCQAICFSCPPFLPFLPPLTCRCGKWLKTFAMALVTMGRGHLMPTSSEKIMLAQIMRFVRFRLATGINCTLYVSTRVRMCSITRTLFLCAVFGTRAAAMGFYMVLIDRCCTFARLVNRALHEHHIFMYSTYTIVLPQPSMLKNCYG